MKGNPKPLNIHHNNITLFNMCTKKSLTQVVNHNIQALKISYYASHWANEYAKEKEEKEKEKTTIITKYHGELLTTMSDCLFNNTLVY